MSSCVEGAQAGFGNPPSSARFSRGQIPAGLYPFTSLNGDMVSLGEQLAGRMEMEPVRALRCIVKGRILENQGSMRVTTG